MRWPSMEMGVCLTKFVVHSSSGILHCICTFSSVTHTTMLRSITHTIMLNCAPPVLQQSGVKVWRELHYNFFNAG